jgi:hypothetical protein
MMASARGRKANRWEGKSVRSDIDGGRIDNGRTPTGTASNIKRFYLFAMLPCNVQTSEVSL